MPRLTGHGLDLHDALGDLGDLQLEERPQQVGMGPRHDDLRPLGPLSDLDDVRLEPLAVTIGLGGDLLLHRQERLHLPQVEQRVAVGVLLHDAGHDVALAPRELLVGHLALGVADLLQDHLLGRLSRDAALEVVRHLHLALVDEVPLLVEALQVDVQLAALRIEGRPRVLQLVVDLSPDRRLVGRGQGLLQAVQEDLERDPALSLQLSQRPNQLDAHFLLPGPHSNTVRADEMSP